jgi:predicted MFS family arabinose efflux permease
VDLGALAMVTGALLTVAAQGAVALLAGRLVSGFGAGAVSLAAFATVPAIVAPSRTASVQGVLTATSAGVLGLGPLIGAALVALGGWRLDMAVPLLALAVVPAVRQTVAGHGDEMRAVDPLGAVTALLACGLATFAAQVPGLGLPWPVAAAAAAAAVASVALLLSRVDRPDAFLPAAVLRDGRFALLSLTAAACFGAYLVLATLVPRMLATDLGWSEPAIGAVLLPGAAAAAVAAVLVGRLAAVRGGARAVAQLALAGAVAMAVAAAVPAPAGPLLGGVLGIAVFAGAQVALTHGIPSLVPPADVGGALGAANFLFLSGGSIGAAAIASLDATASPALCLALLAPAPAIAGLAAGLPRRVGAAQLFDKEVSP